MRVSNEKGYTLVAVLLTITIFMILAFSFMGQAANSIKQNKVIETKSQSVALAEMGVTYFQLAVQNVFKSNQQSIIAQVKEARNRDIKNGIFKADDEYIQYAIVLMIEQFKSKLKQTSISIDEKPNAKFNIQYSENDIHSSGKEIMITFNSVGTENDKSTTIGTTMTIDFSNLMSSDGKGEENNGGQDLKLPSGNDIADPGNLKICSQSQSDFTNTVCQINGSKTFDQNDKLDFDKSIFKVTGALHFQNMNNKDMNDSTLYILGSMTTGNMNSLNNSKIHVDGAANFGHFNGNGLTDSIIEIGGNASFDNMKLLRSTIYVDKYKANFGQINGMNDSKIFVNSDAVIKGLDIGSNSIVCINGYLKIENNFNNNSNSKVYAKNSNNNNVIKGDEAFKDGGACSRNTGPSISWGDPSIVADYDYKY
ncbi:type II secretion system protein [Cytobacillus praedii]|uniref:type II secretion system protein n=1 Tax=Cytobacillus praedii TaxID=1742358 RepID=UPI003F7EC6E0